MITIAIPNLILIILFIFLIGVGIGWASKWIWWN